jgi:AcrR family transcriptional regulator
VKQVGKKKTKRDLLMESALDIFTEKGYDKTTIDDIVNRTGCGKGTFYRYFDNKEHLFEKLDEIFLETLSSELKKNCKNSYPVKKYLFEGFKTFLDVFTQHNKIGIIRLEKDIRVKPEDRKKSAQQILSYFSHMREYLNNAKKEGKIKNFNPETILVTIIGSAHFFLFRSLKLGIPYTEQELEETVDVIFYGVSAA